jgi:CHAT domain-containing protein/tetratricopeptide (TPR) repeat protein
MSYLSGHARREPRRIRPHQFAARRLSPRLALLLLFLTAHVYHFRLDAVAQTAPRGAYQPAARPLKEDFESRAANAFAEASRLRSEWTKDSVREAAEKFMEARAAWLAAGRAGGAIDALNSAAEAHFTLGAFRQALRLYTAAAAESRRAGDRRREQAALARAGRTRSYLGDNDLAQKLLAAVLRHYEQQGYAAGTPQDKRLLAEALNHMGEVYHTKGTPLKAQGYLQRSLTLWVEAGDKKGEALAHLNLGHTYFGSGELDSAREQFETARTLAREVTDRTVEALSLVGTGLVHSFEGDEQAALESHFEALGIARTTGDRQSEAVALNGLGQAYEDLGKKQVALDNYGQALKLFLGNESLDYAAGEEYLVARLYRVMDDVEQALTHYARCVALSRRANKKRIEAYALKDIASIYRATGRRGETLKQYLKIHELYRQIGDRRGQAIILNSIGDLASESGDKRRALKFYRRALPLTQAVGDRVAEAATLYNASLAARDSGELEEGIDYAERSIHCIETLRTYVTGPDLRSSYVASVHKHYGLYVDLLMRMDRHWPGRQYAAAALLASERARARSLLELLAETGTDIRSGADPELLAREAALQQTLRDKARRQMQLSGDAETEAEAGEAAREIRRLTAEYQVVQAQLREQNPRYAALTQPQPVSLEDIQAELRDDTALLEYQLGEGRSYLWVLTANSLNSYELPDGAVIEASAREVYALLTSRQAAGGQVDAAYQSRVAASDEVYEEKAHALSRMLLGPAVPHLGARRLLIAAEGVLQYIPFEALPVPDAAGANAQGSASRPPLISRHEVVSLPSMSALIRLRRERSRTNHAPGLVAVLADPVYDADDPRVSGFSFSTAGAAPREAADDTPVRLALRDLAGPGGGAIIARLRHTSVEARAIMSLVPSGQGILATGFEASRETAMSPRLGRYQVIHFATHGLVDSENPEMSGIVLSLTNREGRQADGFLQLHDIYNLDLPAELIVLSACNTGLGEDVKGEGLVGLTRAFLHAGSKSVVASLWKVDDAATAELMRHFYKALLEDGLPPAASLRVAKENMRRQRRWQAPYYWAGFVIQGEYSQRLKIDRGRRATGLIITLAVLLSCGGLYLAYRLRRIA